MITLENLSLSRGSNLLMQQVNATVHPGQRVGLVGNNGSGKSSLFSLLRGEIDADSGDCYLPSHWLVTSVRQETPSLSQPAIEYVLDGHTLYRQAQKDLIQAENLQDGLAIAHAHDTFSAIHGYALPAQAATLLNGLGFSSEQHQQPVADFSGGWRMRLNLAQALIAPSDLLLLDEPTNHLDLDAIIWLQDFLKSHRATQIIIAHDREFLDSLCQHIWHISNQRLDTYRGNYSQFEQTRHEKRAQADAEYAKQSAQRAHLQRFVDRFRAKATKARQAQSRLKALEKLELTPPPPPEQNFTLYFLTPENTPNPLLILDNTTLGYGENTVIKSLKLTIENDARIGLLGRNGAGKSTVMKALAGIDVMLDGQRNAHKYTNIGYFTQHQLDRLEPSQSPLWHLKQILPTISEQEHRNFLGAYGFGGERASSAIEPFSGGEKARLALALIIATKPNLLLLDEPTNHLDLAMRDSLNRALQSYDGAMVIISHDRTMLRSNCNKLYLIDQQQCTEFNGDLDDYRQYLQQNNGTENALVKQEKDSREHSAQNRQAQKRNEADIRRQLRPFKQAVEKCENRIEALEKTGQKLKDALAESSLYGSENKEKLKKLLAEQTDYERQMAEAEEAWTIAEEALAFEQARLLT